MRILTLILLLSITTAFPQKIVVENPSSFERTEVIEIPIVNVKELLPNANLADVRIVDKNSIVLPMQWFDENGDGNPEMLLFLSSVKGKSSETYDLTVSPDVVPIELPGRTFARSVPERLDDFAWENDRVAFRVYGPKGQQEALKGTPGATLSSGIDVWLKKVPYPIIDKWYKGNLESPGFYHKDRGEGYDPYNVGTGRGAGGTGVLRENKLLTSGNFTSYKIIAEGPIRAVFELTYLPYGDFPLTEIKRITLDYGSNFSRFDIRLDREESDYAVGIPDQDNPRIEKDTRLTWQTIDEKGLGIALIVRRDDVTTEKPYDIASASNTVAFRFRPSNTFTFWSGFAWQGSGQITDRNEFVQLVDKKNQSLKHPLKISFEP